MAGQVYGYFLLFGMTVVILITMIMMTVYGSKPDSHQQISSQIQTIGLANFIMIILFGIIMSYFLEINPQYTQSYVLLMVHFCLFLSLMGVSIAAIQQLN